jgi:putative inorganic carbon (HCO3(-)) transporter
VEAVSAVRRWVVRAGAVLLPIAFSPLTYDHYVLPKLLLARLLVLVLAVLFLLSTLLSGAIRIRRTPLDVPLLVFVATAVVATLLSVNPNVAVFGTYSRYDGLLTLVTYAALFWLAVQTISGPDDARALLRSLLAGGYLVALIAIVQWCLNSLAGQASVRAFGTLGNPNVLGAYLVLLSPLAYQELRDARSTPGRLIWANVLLTMGVALLLTVSHSAWLALGAAAVVLVAGRQLPAIRSPRRVLIAVVVLCAALLAAAPIALSRGTDVGQRIHIWQDSLGLIASRPLFGYGPDTFGLVYPGFQTGQWVLGYVQIDKAHSEVLQVAATQGLAGLFAWAWLMAAFVLAFWRGRDQAGAWALFAGWAAYQVVLLVNFTAPAAAFPFWIFAAAALARWYAVREVTFMAAPARRALGVAQIAMIAGLVALAVPAVVAPYLADAKLKEAVDADFGRAPRQMAARPAADAVAWAPHESVYAVEVANIAFEYGSWSDARAAYRQAAALGTFSPLVYRNLAVADMRLGLRPEALAAAKQAVFLDRFDVANQAVLAQTLAPGP